MAHHIRLTEDDYKSVHEDFLAILKKGSFPSGKISFERKLGSLKKTTAIVQFGELAWHKMQSLIREQDKECAWHGLCQRADKDGKHIYAVSDILLYPQKVTGTEVKESEKAGLWKVSLEPEVRAKIRMQGHSHVNMGVTPSGTDNALYNDILSTCTPDSFYVFMIFNKSGNNWMQIYDFEKNICFEDSDISIEVNDDGLGLEAFVNSASEYIEEYKYEKPAQKNAGGSQYTFDAKEDKYHKKYESVDDYYAGLYGGWDAWGD